ncbi:hypothetical protein IAD21_01347 [Abditibacteriota bacterium]|nr:hypothetical protein IAD21_01347 [Abditibacteriota bacterium]
MHRIWIIGASGSGKSTLARQLADKLGLLCVDLDELNWRPNWQAAPEAEFFASVERALETPLWVVAGNYTKAHSLILPHADTVIWLDYSFLFVLGRLLKRTWRRVVQGESCCNGNFETLPLTLSRDSIVLWLLRTYTRRRRGGWNTKRRARHLGKKVLHFRHPTHCAKWLQTLRA